MPTSSSTNSTVLFLFFVIGFATDCSLDAAPRALEPQQLAAKALRYIDLRSKEDRFSGAVLIAKDGRPILRRAWGKRDITRRLPNNIHTRFNLGSIAKNFTGVAAAQLVETGKLDYDWTIGRVMPRYPDKTVREKVKIKHLLTHTSGIPDFWRLWFGAGKPEMRELDDYLKLFQGKPLEFPPGTRVKYSNSGVNLLGRVIEVVSGMNYYGYIKKNIFEPAGMSHTDWFALDDNTPNRAIGYRPPKNGRRIDAAPFNPVRGSPSGGVFSTVDDLLRFEQALFTGRLIRRDSVRLLATRKVDLQPGVGYGYLFFDIVTAGHRWTGHDGGSEGVNAEFRVYRDDGYTVIVLANYERAADDVAGYVGDLITRRRER